MAATLIARAPNAQSESQAVQELLRPESWDWTHGWNLRSPSCGCRCSARKCCSAFNYRAPSGKNSAICRAPRARWMWWLWPAWLWRCARW